jgi:hypothetical protein
MDSHNHYYGHSAILAARAGLKRPAHMNALLQHGWTIGSPVAAHFSNVPRDAARNLLVWSHSGRSWSPAAEQRETHAIGAPWLYLTEQLAHSAAAGPVPAENPAPAVIGFPFHSNETMHVEGSVRDLAEYWRDAHGPMTICLYFTEARQPATVQEYVRAGHRVVTLGDRWDPEFLLRLYGMFRGAELAVSNRLSTSIFYAAGLGIATRVHGDPMRTSWDAADRYDLVAERWPEFHAGSPDVEAQRAIANDELGLGHLRSGAELRDLLAWPASGPRNFYYYWVGSPWTTFRTAMGGNGSAAAAETVPPPPRATGLDRVRSVVRATRAYYPRPLPSMPQLRPSRPLPVSPT